MNRAQLSALIDKHPATVAERIATPSADASTAADSPSAIVIGTSDAGHPVVLDLPKLIAGRLLIQGNSGAGKSMLLRRIFEQAFGRIQQLVVDGEGEFATLAEVFDVAVLTAADAYRVGPETLALHIRQHRYSAVLDLSDASAEDRLDIVAKVAKALVEAPVEMWHPMLVLIDEAQVLAPFYDNGDAAPDTRKASIVAIAELMGRGRKRGLAGVIATARIAETSKAVISKATNAIVGRTIFDRDMERAGALLGFTAARASALRSLGDGEFLAIGPAIAGPKRVRFRSGPVKSEHKGRAPEIIAPPTIGAQAAADLLKQVPDAADPPEQRVKGVRGRGWHAGEDAIIKEGYDHSLLGRQIADQLVEAGFKRRSVSGISTRARDLGLVSARAAAGWTDEEDQILVDAYAREVRIMDICGLLADAGYDRGRVSIQMRAIALGITRDRVNYWTEPEKAIALAGLEAGRPHREVLQELRDAGFERGVTSLFKFSQKHNFNRKPDSWTSEDIETLRVRYEAKVSVKDIAIELGKTEAGIRTKASLLGFKQRTAWTDHERQILIDGCAAGEMLIHVAAKIGRPYPNVAAEARRMELSFRRVIHGESPTPQEMH